VSHVERNIIGVLALICAEFASARIGAFQKNEGMARLVGFALVFGNCFILVTLGYFTVKRLFG
jgi:hypothetical protein